MIGASGSQVDTNDVTRVQLQASLKNRLRIKELEAALVDIAGNVGRYSKGEIAHIARRALVSSS